MEPATRIFLIAFSAYMAIYLVGNWFVSRAKKSGRMYEHPDYDTEKVVDIALLIPGINLYGLYLAMLLWYDVQLRIRIEKKAIRRVRKILNDAADKMSDPETAEELRNIVKKHLN